MQIYSARKHAAVLCAVCACLSESLHIILHLYSMSSAPLRCPLRPRYSCKRSMGFTIGFYNNKEGPLAIIIRDGFKTLC